MPEYPPHLKEAIQRSVDWAETRARQCRCFIAGQCLHVSGYLGWSHKIDQNTCDSCHALGGETSEAAAHLRREAAQGVARFAAKRAMERPSRYQPEVLVQLTIRHRLVPDDRFNAPDFQEAIHSRNEWAKVKPTWQKALSFVRAITSKVTSSLSAEDYEKRLISCHGIKADGTVVGAPCRMRRSRNDQHWCGACGCGETALAELDHKLKYPFLECPLGKEGFSNG